ncbi:hypothetical protein PIB30_076459 [Stylosanthes scabra]|uniref:Uncharacterized protein n=1 Tax=Stylosanthes scabra TaxID=79078 RepID=A0ABU6QPV7_9FABA|nr:hypothetical protein [Stylosanthes scabra]
MRGYVDGMDMVEGRLARMGMHMRRNKRICMEGRGYAEVSGWIWLVSGTHMRGGYAYAWVTEPGFNRLRISYLVLPLLIYSEPSQHSLCAALWAACIGLVNAYLIDIQD